MQLDMPTVLSLPTYCAELKLKMRCCQTTSINLTDSWEGEVYLARPKKACQDLQTKAAGLITCA